MTRRTPQAPPASHTTACPTCGKRTAAECSAVDCGNRKRVTAQPPDDLEQLNGAAGTYRVPRRPGAP
ncbi:MAG: hypothetical protein ACOZJZ_12705 [Pseudomonadota bacterium]